MSLRVAFYKAAAGHWWDKVIAWKTGSKYSHCELVFSDGVAFSASPRDGCARFKTIDFDEEKWDFVEVTESPDEKVIRGFCDKVAGSRYDWPGIAKIGAGIGANVKQWWFCSEVIVAALQADLYLDYLKPEEITPGMLHLILTFYNEEHDS